MNDCVTFECQTKGKVFGENNEFFMTHLSHWRLPLCCEKSKSLVENHGNLFLMKQMTDIWIFLCCCFSFGVVKSYVRILKDWKFVKNSQQKEISHATRGEKEERKESRFSEKWIFMEIMKIKFPTFSSPLLNFSSFTLIPACCQPFI